VSGGGKSHFHKGLDRTPRERWVPILHY
jgi:hypothetical protein